MIETPPFLRLTWQYTRSPVNLERDIGEHSTVTDAICLAFVITGFLGGLTTFSSFSAEVVGFMQRGEVTWALGTALLHLLGSLCLTFLGILTYQALK